MTPFLLPVTFVTKNPFKKSYGYWQEDLNLLSYALEAGMLTIRLCSSAHDIKEKISEYIYVKSPSILSGERV